MTKREYLRGPSSVHPNTFSKRMRQGSVYEHRPAARAKERIVLNEADPLLLLLFLNNNLHLVHHDLPSLPWYLLPRVYRARRHGSRAVDAPVHPQAS